MRPFPLFVCVFLLASGTTGAQSTTEDGIRALLRGDDLAAARILSPLAYTDVHPDPVAQFFLAVMYETGRGVGRSLTACSLFVRAAVPANPFMEQSETMAAAIGAELGEPLAAKLCVAKDPGLPLPSSSGPGPSMHEQPGTADGVAAIAHGEYARAGAILKPIAEDWRGTDSAAEFFMAGLYDAGRGVPLDPLRACALYSRAGTNWNDAFGQEANRLVKASLQRGGGEFVQECQTLANLGLNNGPEPVTFDLGPEQSVAWTLATATVTYRGTVKHIQTGGGPPGAHFLPVQETELLTGPAHSIPRHFVEVFLWD
ncbi:MAG TPA: hypothetical protein VGL62_08640, partial [Vicinamibacterales bacterium]